MYGIANLLDELDALALLVGLGGHVVLLRGPEDEDLILVEVGIYEVLLSGVPRGIVTTSQEGNL